MSPAHTLALAEITSRSSGLPTGEEANAWRHAALVTRNFPDTTRALRQLLQHASFAGNGAKDGITRPTVKTEIYTKAADILSELTGVPLPQGLPANPTRLEIAYDACPESLLPGFGLAFVA